ncbi:hypothetical protein F4823DRAFT_568697 [Ustulina deusta]|nr:hypothetical protein F4823DRAFT_568697 [Ustulina deusta]
MHLSPPPHGSQLPAPSRVFTLHPFSLPQTPLFRDAFYCSIYDNAFHIMLRSSRREDGSEQPTKNTDSKRQSPSPTRPAAVDRVRPQSARSTNISRLSTPVPSTASGSKDPTAVVQGSTQNISPQPTAPSISGPHIQPDLWDAATATLSDDDKRWLERATGDATIPAHNVVDKMIVLATEKQRRCEESGWKTVRLGEYEISLADMASRTIIWLNKFKEIGDIVVQYDPTHAALPWAAVRFILQAVVMTKEQMAASLAILEKATRIIHRCQVFEGLYNRTTVAHAVVENLEYLSGRTPARFFYAIFHPGAGSYLLTSLEKGEEQVEREILACEGQRKATTNARFQEQLCGLLKLTEPVLRVDNNIESLLQRLDRDDLTRVLEWISPIEYRRHHDTVRELRTNDTCNCLLQRPKFGQWSSATSSITLWLQGFPGSGKTYLTSRIIEQTEVTLRGKANDESFAFFYCNRNEENRRNALDILRSYVRQLSTTSHRSDFIYSQLEQLFDDSRLRGSDALDECSPGERTSLLDFFDSIPSKCSHPVRIFISSRPEGDIRQRLIHLSNIEIQATDNEDDIAKFVMQSIDKNGRWREALQKNQSLKDEIMRTLLAKSNGMFQWAMLQIKQLLNLRTEREIRSRLGKLPFDLKAAYDEIFATIEALHADAGALSFRALRWVMCTYQPLTSAELVAAIHVDPEKGILEALETTETDLLDWCANLLRIDAQQDPPVWRVSHLSVVEYLETHWTVLEAHCFVAKASLVLLQETYGSEHDKQSQPADIFEPKHPLQLYARYHWIRHVQTQEHRDADPRLAHLLKAFLGSLEESSMQYRRWYHQIRSDPPIQLPGSACTIPFTTVSDSTIFLACHFAIYTLLREWWDAIPIQIIQPARRGVELLTRAAAGGCKPLCLKLYELGIPVNMPLETGTYGSGLLWPKLRLGIFNMPLENISLKTGNYESKSLRRELYGERIPSTPVNTLLEIGSPLEAAASEGHTEIVQFLVHKGADINMPLQTSKYGSALAAAAYQGHANIVEFLVNNGADINMLLQIGEYGSALAAAAYMGRAEIVEFLVNNGADINMPLQAGEYGSALSAAVVGGKTKIVQLLVNKGADVNIPLKLKGMVGIGEVEEYTNSLQILINKGADIDLSTTVLIMGVGFRSLLTILENPDNIE